MNAQLCIGSSNIRQFEGLYSLNDLHVASGGDPIQKPVFFLRNDKTKELANEINKGANSHLSIKTIRGVNGGSFGCKEIVYAYAMWISPAFMLKVIRAYDSLNTKEVIEEPKYSKMSPEQQKVIESAIRQRAHVLATLVQPMYEHHMRTGKIVFKTHDDVQKWYPQDDPYLSPRAGIKLDPIEFPNMNTGNYPNDPHQQFSYESWIKMVHAQKSPIFKLVQQLEKQGYDVTTVWEEYALLGDLLSRMNQSFTFFRDHCSRPHTISFAPPGSKARKSGKRLFV